MDGKRCRGRMVHGQINMASFGGDKVTNGSLLLAAHNGFKLGRMGLFSRGLYDRADRTKGYYPPPSNTFPLISNDHKLLGNK
ncbi:unnamed protein product [Pieris macdunnoughi]|uniref:Uncharacterized protein n=1 Tax=Pieris macdunnoughi TaxID=345717 RepID=A0A821WDC7_9NEOP|nr:unnamed protein product [Pieris macdunnoughi]